MSTLDNEPEKKNQDDRTKGMVIAGVAASEVLDSSGERISIKNTDISDLENGTATLNVEHAVQGEDGAFGQETVGKIFFAKKIFGEDDCENDIQRKFWDQVKAPLIFILGRLYDAAGHDSAKAIAAQIRDHHANNEMINCRLSIEGITLHKDEDGYLTATVARKVSITLKPCNRTCDTELILDPQAPPGFDKAPVTENLAKSLRKAIPGISTTIGSFSVDIAPVLLVPELRKALDSGGYTGGTAPGNLTGGAALATESVSGVKSKKRRQVIDLVAAYNPDKVSKQEFETKLKELLPELGEDYLKHFHELAEKIHVRNRASKLGKVEQLTPIECLVKVEEAYIELKKALGPEDEKSVPFGGHNVVPGKIQLADRTVEVLFEDRQYYYVVPEGKISGYSVGDLAKLPKLKEGRYFRVISRPHLPISSTFPVAPSTPLGKSERLAKEERVSFTGDAVPDIEAMGPEEVGQLFETTQSPYVKSMAATSPKLPAKYLKEVLNTNWPTSDMRRQANRAVSYRKDLDPETWKVLYGKDPAWGLGPLQRHPELMKDPGVEKLATRDQNYHDTVISNPHLSESGLGHILTNSTDSNVRIDAAAHPALSEQNISDFIDNISDPKNLNSQKRAGDIATEMAKNPKFSPDHTNRLMAHPHLSVKQAAAYSKHVTPEQLGELINNWEPGSHRVAAASSDNLPADMASKVLRDEAYGENVHHQILHRKDLRPEDLAHVVRDDTSHSYATQKRALAHQNMDPKTLSNILMNPDESGAYRHIAARHKNTSPEALKEAAFRNFRVGSYANSAEPEDGVLSAALLQNPSFSPEHVTDLINAFPKEQDPRENRFLRGRAIFNRGDLTTEQLQAGLDNPNLAGSALSHPKISSQQLGEFWGKNKTNEPYHSILAEHPNTPDAVLNELQSSGDGNAAMIARSKIKQQSPDAYHDEHVMSSLGTGKLRKLRDLMESKGVSEIHPNKLPPGDFSKIREPNGNVSLKAIQAAIDNSPKTRWNVSHDRWEGAQRHNDHEDDDEGVTSQNVFQMNLSDHHLRALREAGAYPEFKKLAQASFSSNHPVTNSTVGWVRYTGDPHNGYHIDEVQSDFGQSFHKKIAGQAKSHAMKEAEEKGLKGADAEKYVTKRQGELTAEGHKYLPDDKHALISNILFQGKPANEHIFEAFRQYMRDKGHHNTPIHINTPALKAPLSGLKENHPIPGHFHQTYEKIPKQAGFTEAKYGDLPTQNNPQLQGKPTLQDKVRKSLG